MTDARNGQEYTVRKLKDEKCWMIDNLKFALEQGMVLTPQDTNLEPGTQVTVDFAWDKFTSGTKDITERFVTSGSNTRDGSLSQTLPNYDAWRQNDPNYNPNCLNGVAYNADSKSGCGYFYNYYTATAGSAAQADYDNGKGADYIAKSSICPAGWKLPSGQNANGDFGFLDKLYLPGTGDYHNGTANITNQGLWTPAGAWRGSFSGLYNSYFDGQGSYGDYWTSSVYTTLWAYDTVIANTGVHPGTSYYSRYRGFALRCLVD
jgi:uncharacterized protein (TIGR02145 family)